MLAKEYFERKIKLLEEQKLFVENMRDKYGEIFLYKDDVINDGGHDFERLFYSNNNDIEYKLTYCSGDYKLKTKKISNIKPRECEQFSIVLSNEEKMIFDGKETEATICLMGYSLHLYQKINGKIFFYQEIFDLVEKRSDKIKQIIYDNLIGFLRVLVNNNYQFNETTFNPIIIDLINRAKNLNLEGK